MSETDISRTGIISFFGMRRTAQECATFAFTLRAALDAAEADTRRAVAAERDACAKIAENAKERDHIAFDIRNGEFPRRSDTRDFIAASIRAIPLPAEPAPMTIADAARMLALDDRTVYFLSICQTENDVRTTLLTIAGKTP